MDRATRPVMIATKTTKCLDRCGLTIHQGYDEIEPGHFGFRHVDCDKARAEEWIRERIAAGDQVADVQIKLIMHGDAKYSGYVLDYADRQF